MKTKVEIKNNGSIMGRSKLKKINCLLIDLVHTLISTHFLKVKNKKISELFNLKSNAKIQNNE